MAAVKPIPEGFHAVTPYLVVDDADKAIAFYKNAFGATEVVRMPGPGGKVMHAEIQIGDSRIMLSSEMSEMGAKSPKAYGGSPASIHLYVKDADAAFKKAIAAGATEQLPVTEMFWGDRFGKVKDPFGYGWSIATHIKDLTPEQIKKGQQEWMAQMASNR